MAAWLMELHVTSGPLAFGSVRHGQLVLGVCLRRVRLVLGSVPTVMTYWILEAYLPLWWAGSWKLTYHDGRMALGSVHDMRNTMLQMQMTKSFCIPGSPWQEPSCKVIEACHTRQNAPPEQT